MKQTLEQEVNEPIHYRSHESGIEAIEITRWLQFDLGNCWKYCMRYRDKGTPKKDLKKAIWYIRDFNTYFIDYKHDSTFIHSLSNEIVEKMCKVAEAEPREEIKAMFNLMIMIATLNQVLDEKIIDNTIYELEQFAETLN